MSDYFLEHRAKQPKKEIGDYVESQGILVPRRFETLKEAKNFGGEILVRSEHPQDYDGASGLIDTVFLDEYRNNETEEELKSAILNKRHDSLDVPRQIRTIRRYCEITSSSQEDFIRDIQYSFWEYIYGFNITVVADRALKNRYHTLAFKKNSDHEIEMAAYSIFENNRTELEKVIGHRSIELSGGLLKIIDLYQEIRNLDRFDKCHCPIIEFKLNTTGTYFLQYHRARDFSEANFIIDKDYSDYKKALFVIGSTKPDGMISKVATFYPKIDTDYPNQKINMLEQGSFDWHYDSIFSEIMTRYRDLQIDEDLHKGDIAWQLFKYCISHLRKSILFKPKISILNSIEDAIVKKDEVAQMRNKRKIDKQTQYITVHTISDGRNAYIKRID